MNNTQKAEQMILMKVLKNTPHLKEALIGILEGRPSKVIANELGIADVTVRALKVRYKEEIKYVTKEKEE